MPSKKFKPGDRVEYFDGGTAARKRIGHTGTVKSEERYTAVGPKVDIKWDDDYESGYAYQTCNLRLISEPELIDFTDEHLTIIALALTEFSLTHPGNRLGAIADEALALLREE